MIDRRFQERRISDVRRRLLEESKGVSDAENLATLSSLAYAIEARDPFLRGHSERVAAYASWIAKHLKYPDRKIDLLRNACRLHDIGKISVPDKILLKPGKLTQDERAKMELHPVHGTEILGHLRFLKKGIPFILHHHERYDGKGYPYGLKSKQIPIEARIIAMADAFDAMISDRPYRKGLSMDQVIHEIRANIGKQFDPIIAKIFLKMIRDSNIRSQIEWLQNKKAA